MFDFLQVLNQIVDKFEFSDVDQDMLLTAASLRSMSIQKEIWFTDLCHMQRLLGASFRPAPVLAAATEFDCADEAWVEYQFPGRLSM